MKIGVHLPHIGPTATRDGIREFAQAVEGIGYDSVWVSDHIVIPRRIASRSPYTSGGEFTLPPDLPFLEPLATLAFVAGCTERVTLGTSLFVAAMRNPVLTAKWIATVDVLAGGRLVVGVDTGWMEEEFAALDIPFADRGRRLEEYLALMKLLWTRQDISFDGDYYHVHDIGFAPKPLQKPHPPVWISGNSAIARRRAARFADAWQPVGLSTPRLVDGYADVSDMATEFGRKTDLAPRVGVRLDDASLPATLHLLSDYRDAGATHVLLEPAGMQDIGGTIDRLERLHDRLTPELIASAR